MKQAMLFTIFFTVIVNNCAAQGIFKKEKQKEVDTLYQVYLDSVNIEARSLKNYNYNRYQKIVAKVYPIADTAVFLLNEIEKTISNLEKKKDQKKYLNELEDQLKAKFENKLKNMSRTEGSVLIELIERKSQKPLYSILKDVKNGGTAFWWQNLGKFYGYNLKDGYNANNNPLLEAVIVEYEAKKR